MDLAEIRRIEDANLNSFPSEMQVVDGGWVTRLSPGNPARRVNSLNVFDPRDDTYAAERLKRSQDVFVAHSVPFHLRVTPLTPLALVAHADGLGWAHAGDTDVWVRSLTERAQSAPGRSSDGFANIVQTDLSDWIVAFGAIGGTRPEAVTPVALSRLQQSLERVAVSLVSLVAFDDARNPIAAAIAIADGPQLGIYDVAVAPGVRRRGLGARMVEACLDHGSQSACRQAWLQVLRDNQPARALYAGLGFEHAYSYHYRFALNTVQRS